MTPNQCEDELRALIKRGYSAPPPDGRFIQSLHDQLVGRLEAQSTAPRAADRRRRHATARPRTRPIPHCGLLAGLTTASILAIILCAPQPQEITTPPSDRADQAVNVADGHGNNLIIVGDEDAIAHVHALVNGLDMPDGCVAVGGSRLDVTAPQPPPTFQPTIPPYIPRDGLLALWLADGNAFDSAGKNHGAAEGVNYLSDRRRRAEGAFHFDGKVGMVKIPDNPSFDRGDALSVGVWVRPDTSGRPAGGECALVSKWQSTIGWGDYQLILSPNAHEILFRVWDNPEHLIHEYIVSDVRVAPDTWTHVLATFHGGLSKVYLNAIPVPGKTRNRRAYGVHRQFDGVTIGAQWDGSLRFTGAIDEVAIWNRALSAEDVAGLWDAVPAGLPDLTRTGEADRIALAGGSVLLGTIENEKYSLATSFGQVQIPAARVAGLARTDEKDTAVRLLLTDGQVLIGKLGDEAIRLKLSTGSTLSVPVDSILQCGYRVSDEKPSSGAGETGSLLKNGSFEEPPSPPAGSHSLLATGSTTMPGWKVVRGSVDHNNGEFRAADGTCCIDLEGVSAVGGVSQTFATRPGQEYRVTFAMSGNTAGPPTVKRLRVQAAGQSAEFQCDITGQTQQSLKWQRKTWTFRATAAETTIEFLSANPEPGDFGALLDDVVVLPAGPESAGPTVILKSGERLRFTNADLGLRLGTAYGEVSLPIGLLQRAELAGADGKAHHVRLTNGSMLSGTLLPKELALALELGPKVTLGWDRIRWLVRPAPSEPPEPETTVVTRRGDRLCGDLVEASLTAATEFGPATVPVPCTLRLAFDGRDSTDVSLTQWDGVTIRGRLASDSLTIALAPGGAAIRVPVAQIASLERSFAVPVPEDVARIEALIPRLGDRSYEQREWASQALLRFGPHIGALLRGHLKTDDAEICRRIEEALTQLENLPRTIPTATGTQTVTPLPPGFSPGVPFHIPQNGLVALWLADGNANDSAGENHGKPENVTYTTDRHGQANAAFRFDGKSTIITVPDANPLDTDEAFTLSAWISPERLPMDPGGSVILDKWDQGDRHADYLLWLCADGRIGFAVCISDAGFVRDDLISSKKVPLGREWTNVAATFDRGRMNFYINGQLDGSKTSTTVKQTTGLEYENDDVHIGAPWHARLYNKHWFEGAVDEVAIWNRALSEAEIKGIYEGTDAGMAGVPRIEQADYVLLDTGDPLLGTIENEQYRIVASFGEMTLSAEQIVSFARPANERGPAATHLVLTDGQVLVGKLAASPIRLCLSTGSVLTVPVDRIRQAGYRLSDRRPAAIETVDPMLILASGERLSLAKLDISLDLVTTGGTVALPPTAVLRVEAADPTGLSHRVHFTNGSTLSGSLIPGELTAHLILGPTFIVGWENVRYLVRPAKPVPPQGKATLLLRNGDRLLGQVEHETITIRTKFGPATVRVESILAADFDAKKPGIAAVKQWDGVILEGPLAEESLAFRILPGGPAVKVPISEITSLRRSSANPPPEVVKQVEALIAQLGADAPAEREAATNALIAMGPKIAPLLRKHANHDDAEVRWRIAYVLQQFESH